MDLVCRKAKQEVIKIISLVKMAETLPHVCSPLKPFTPNGPIFHNSFDRSISNSSVSGYFIITCRCFIEIPPFFNANSVDPDQTLHSVASDLGLHYLPVTFLEVSRLKWVK